VLSVSMYPYVRFMFRIVLNVPSSFLYVSLLVQNIFVSFSPSLISVFLQSNCSSLSFTVAFILFSVIFCFCPLHAFSVSSFLIIIPFFGFLMYIKKLLVLLLFRIHSMFGILFVLCSVLFVLVVFCLFLLFLFVLFRLLDCILFFLAG